jgi:L-fuconolactonase
VDDLGSARDAHTAETGSVPRPSVEILDPDIEIVDAHHHLFGSESTAHLPGRYLLQDFLADTRSGHHVVESVAVECGWLRAGPPERPLHSSLPEVAALAAIANESDRLGGTRVRAIVGYLDLQFGSAAGEALDKMSELGAGRLSGIRHSVSFDPDPALPRSLGTRGPHMFADHQWRLGFRALSQRGLTFDAMLFHPQLGDVVDLARQFPETRIVVNHLGAPIAVGGYADRLNEIRAETLSHIKTLVPHPNVYLKLGGIGNSFMTPTVPRPRTRSWIEIAAPWRTHIRECINLLGVDRCMFESNFPVDARLCDYGTLWNAMKSIVRDYSRTEKASLFADTARVAYGLRRV